MMNSTSSNNNNNEQQQQCDIQAITNELSQVSPTLLHVDQQQDNVSTTTSTGGTATTLTDAEYWERYLGKNSKPKNHKSNFKLLSFLSVASNSKGCSYLGEGTDEGSVFGTSSGDQNFDPKEYSLVYGQVLKDKECSELFLAFLRISKAEEPLEFMLACDEYKRFYQKLIESYGYIDTEEPQQGNTEQSQIVVVVKKGDGKDEDQNNNNKDEKEKNIIQHEMDSPQPIGMITTEGDHPIGYGVLLEKQVATRKEHFTKLITKLKKDIIERFIQEEAEKELHRGPLKSELLKNWQSILNQHNELTMKEHEKYSILELKTQRTIISQIINKLNPNTILKDLYSSVYLDLQVDLFPWFCKHPDLLYFLKVRGEEYTRSIAVKNFRFNISDWRIKESDMKEKVIRREHFYFGFALLEDSKDWKVIRDKKNVKASISKQLYTFDKNLASKMCLNKFSTTVPCSLEKFWNIWSNIDNHTKLDPQCEIQVKECHTSTVSLLDPNPFAHGVIDSMSKLHFRSTKKYKYIYTIIEEPTIDSIFMIGHSFQEDQLEKEQPETTDYLKGFFFYLFRNLKETNETRIEMCHYLDVKVFLSSLHNSSWIKQCKHFTRTIQSLLSNTSTTNISHNDSLNYNKILQHNRELNVSYYESWVKLKNQQKNKA